MIFGNYRADAGTIMVRDAREWVDVASAPPRRVLHLRQSTIGYVSQFLRTIPRVGALDIVAASARDNGVEPNKARARAAELLDRLNIPEKLWQRAGAALLGIFHDEDVKQQVCDRGIDVTTFRA
jgi:alpha-D-ribose 1-methylphosphonate 5-triphosphate synthase subunit PhnL